MRITVISILLLACVTCPLIGTVDEDRINETLGKFVEALNTHKYSVVSDYIGRDFQVQGVPAGYAKEVLKQVIAQYPERIIGFKTGKLSSIMKGISVTVDIIHAEEIKTVTVDLDSEGRIIGTDLFRTQSVPQNELEEDKEKLPDSLVFSFRVVHGLIVTQGSVDGHEGLWIVDSGAPRTILNAASDPSERTISMGVSGVGGAMTGMNITTVKTWTWGDWKRENFRTLTTDLTHLADSLDSPLLGLIGYSALEPFLVELDYTQRILRLTRLDRDGNPVVTRNRQHGTKVRFGMEAHIPVFDVKIGDETYRMGLDTGAEANMIDVLLDKELEPYLTWMEPDTLLGAANVPIIAKTARLSELRLKKLPFTNMTCVISDMTPINGSMRDPIQGLLGYQLLKQRPVTINFREQYMVFSE